MLTRDVIRTSVVCRGQDKASRCVTLVDICLYKQTKTVNINERILLPY